MYVIANHGDSEDICRSKLNRLVQQPRLCLPREGLGTTCYLQLGRTDRGDIVSSFPLLRVRYGGNGENFGS